MSHIKVIAVDEKEFSITIETFFNIDWQDERLELTQHHSNGGLMPVDEDLVDHIWKPNVFIYDLNSFEVVEVLGKMSGVWVDEMKNVLYSQAVRMKLFCLMDFGRFPFDVQSCRIRVGSYSYNDKKMSFIQKDIGMNTKEASTLPPEIDVVVLREDKGETNIDYGALGNFSIAGCWVHVSRDSTSYLTSFYFPTALLVMISLMSFLVPVEETLCRFFLLVLPLFMVIYLQRSATFLVPSSGLTALDIWMLSCIAFILIAMIEQAGLLMMNQNKSKTQRVDKVSLITLSLAFVAFIAVYSAAVSL